MAVIEGTAYWASVTSPNTKFEPVYTINLVVDDDVAKQFAGKGHKVKQLEAGPSIVIKRKAQDKNGKKKAVPKLVDDKKEPIDTLVGNGSRVRVQYHEWETTNNYGTFKGLDLQAVQVLELVPYGDRSLDGDELGIKPEEEDEF